MKTRPTRKVCVVTGTRAEYGILYPAMKAIQSHPGLDLSVLVTGMHLMPEFGYTVKEIEADGFVIDAKVPMYLSADTNAAIVTGLGLGIIGIAQALEQIEPDIIVVLGDRAEPLTAAIAGAYMNIPVAHIHGGDRSGGIDESIRHAITKFAHIHFPATPESGERLIRMGEEPWRIHVVGPLGIYAMGEADFTPRNELCKKLGLNPTKLLILVVQHPVTTQAKNAPEQMRATMEALVELGEQAVIVYPNADAGGRAMIEVIKEYENCPFIKTFKSLPRKEYVSLMKLASVMVGNSSSGIIEAPSLGLPVVNIGIRQEGRERGKNVIDVGHNKQEIVKGIEKALADKEFLAKVKKCESPYGDGKAAPRVAEILGKIEVTPQLLQKKITY